MAVTDDILLRVMTDASEGKGILFLTKSTGESDSLVPRATRILIENLRKYGKVSVQQARLFVIASDNKWQIRLRSGGWAFFVPDSEVKPHDNVNNPTYVYAKDDKGKYDRMTYFRWKSQFPAPEAGSEVAHDEVAMSSWNRLLADED